MSGRVERSPTELMRLYWAACRSRQEQPRRVWGLVALSGATHPEGHLLTWGVGRKYVETQHEKRGDADKWEIREFAPT